MVRLIGLVAAAGLAALCLLSTASAGSESAPPKIRLHPDGQRDIPAMKSASQIRAELLAMNYSDVIDDCGYITLAEAEQPSNPVYLRVGDFAAGVKEWQSKNSHGVSLTEREWGHLLGWNSPDGGHEVTLTNLITVLDGYHMQYGKLPDCGLDLYPELLTADGYQAFLRLTRKEQLLRLCFIINPSTGRIYDSFAHPKWECGAVDVSIIADKNELEQNYKAQTNMAIPDGLDGRATKPCNQIWVITFYGESPNTIIYKWELPRAL
jgi:hypothetical protein